MKDLFKKVDRMVFRGERMFVVGALLLMSVVVFLDVVYRTFAGDEHKGVTAFVKFLSYFGSDIERGDAAYVSLESWFPYVLWIAFVGLGVLGIRTAGRGKKMPFPKAIAFSAVGVVAVYGLIRLFLMLAPNGLIWAQNLALVLTLWVGFLAASMCTHENKHLKVEAAQRAIPEKFKPYVVFLSSLFSALVCFGLMWVALRYVLQRHDDFIRSEGRGAVVDGLDLPLYQAMAVLPLSFLLMTIRFAARGAFALGGELPQSPTIEGLDQLDKYAAEQPAPSDVPTEVGSVSGDRPVPQSQVPTDAHEVPEDEPEPSEAKPVSEERDEEEGR
ncbi:MAG: TRAP transporter small permease [Nannocystaceae bacterium]|nr:TRAP transporter small permease [bacterium]